MTTFSTNYRMMGVSSSERIHRYI